ncbi:MAG: enoyl-CoA hydratase-related protein, partial [Chitinophagales bacterium]
AEALSYGLINEIIPKEDIGITVKSFAIKLSEEASSQSLAATKEMMQKVATMELDDALNYAAEMNAKTRSSDDCRKGVGAFLKKEKFKW